MREIKFRAWNGAEQKMHGNVGISPHTQEYHVFDKYGAIHDAYGSMPVLMQFTGLLDQNGHEIYEGDIVQWNGIDGIHRQTVRYVNDRAMFLPNNMKGEVEVVGNIYEHPHLLQEGNQS